MNSARQEEVARDVASHLEQAGTLLARSADAETYRKRVGGEV
jgi:hypothetical protein